MSISVSPDTNKRRSTFFKLAFGEQSGYVCIATLKDKQMHEQFFFYPDQVDEMLEYINRNYIGNNLYYCPQLLSTKKRTKEHVDICPTIWADLDECPPNRLIVPPSVITETSSGRYQALWVLEHPLDPETAEDISRRIAYYHAEDGADKSGWDLTQLLRIPLTYNLKYDDEQVKVVDANDKRYREKDFEAYPQAQGFEYLEIPMPETLPETPATQILENHKNDINPLVWSLFYEQPTSDWSKNLWQLEMLLFETGLDRDHVFLIAEASACNKYKRDKRPRELLWKEVCKAQARLEQREKDMFFTPQAVDVPVLLKDHERKWVEENPSIIEEYVEWAKGLGDAAWQYHQAGAFTILSSLLSGAIRLPTSYGIVKPNLWFLILADTTLTRKTTAMDLAMDQILEIDPDCILATDGSIEGLMQGIST
ncbi:MAG: DNA-primase RepB domain-containing protein, partial [Dehalococcoidales bacterium]